MIKNYAQSVEINHNPNRLYISDHLYRILIIGGLGSGKINVLFNLIKNQRPDIDKNYLYVKDPFELKYWLLKKKKKYESINYKIQNRSLVIYKQLIQLTIIQRRKGNSL